VDDVGDGFEVFAEGAGDFGGRMIVAEGAPEFENGCVGASQFFDPAVDVSAVCGNVFAERDENVAEKNGHAGNGLGVDFAELCFVFGVVDEVNAEFLQKRTKVVLDLNAVQIHGNFEAGDGIAPEEDFVILADVEQFDGEDVGGVAQLVRCEKLRRRLFEFAGPPVNDSGEASQVGGFCGMKDAKEVEVGSAFVEVAARGGTIEHDGLEIVASGFVKAPGELR